MIEDCKHLCIHRLWLRDCRHLGLFGERSGERKSKCRVLVGRRWVVSRVGYSSGPFPGSEPRGKSANMKIRREETGERKGGGVPVIWASPRFGHPHSQNPSDVGIPCINLTQIAKVVWEGNAHITRVFGMGMPKTWLSPFIFPFCLPTPLFAYLSL